MPRICTAVRIRRPIEQIFDFATTPRNWPKWHPSSLGVRGAIDHSLLEGEQVTEEYRVAGHTGQVTWIVRERDAPRRWVIEGKTTGGGDGSITYTLTLEATGTLLERVFVYAMPTFLMRLLDVLMLRRRVGSESLDALRRLKELLESR